MFKDNFNRTLTYLRLSLTDVCNFRCSYCLPNGYSGIPKNALTTSEIINLIHALSQFGVSKVRLTGGEPTIKKNFIEIANSISSIPKINTLALTTNGYYLAENVKEYRKAGINRITLSIDSFDAAKFKEIVGRDLLPRVLAGLHACLNEDFSAIKVNTVLLKNLNSSTEDIAQYFSIVKDMPISIRFIELMATDDSMEYYKNHYISTTIIKNHLIANNWELVKKTNTDGPAVEYVHPDCKGRIGVISPYSEMFCHNCNRLRVSADGNLYLCLFENEYVPLRHLLQHKDQQDELCSLIKESLASKKISHFLQTGNIGKNKHFSSIGG